jgi:hypothetical protein
MYWFEDDEKGIARESEDGKKADGVAMGINGAMGS